MNEHSFDFRVTESTISPLYIKIVGNAGQVASRNDLQML